MPQRIATGNIFISYRREDAAAYAGRLCDHLGTVFGAERVFMDVEDLAPGEVFTDTIDRTIAGCEVVLVVIGPRWIEVLRDRVQEQQPDYVCHEIDAALARKLPIVPVLVGGATMAQLSELPEKIATLSLYHAAELRDSTFKDDCIRLSKSLNLAIDSRTASALKNGRRGKWISAAVVAGIVLVLAAVFGFSALDRWNDYRARNSAVSALLDTARTQENREEYESAFRSYQKALTADPTNRNIAELQADAAMGWLRNFHVLVPEGASAEDLAGPVLAELIGVLDTALARTAGQGLRAANVLAHIGWAHWLNQRIAHKEFGPAAERDLRESLRLDDNNVFANAMLGNWIIQNHGSTVEALRRLKAAVNTGKERPFVRRMQLGAMVYDRDPQLAQALIRVANDMRKNGEPIDDVYKRRILSAYSPTVNDADELRRTFSAVPPDDAWATFLWLDRPEAAADDSQERRLRHQFIHASILELDGKSQQALVAFTDLQRELKARGYDGRIATHVAGAVKRLSR
jgi:hypothetical protein